VHHLLAQKATDDQQNNTVMRHCSNTQFLTLGAIVNIRKDTSSYLLDFLFIHNSISGSVFLNVSHK